MRMAKRAGLKLMLYANGSVRSSTLEPKARRRNNGKGRLYQPEGGSVETARA